MARKLLSKTELLGNLNLLCQALGADTRVGLVRVKVLKKGGVFPMPDAALGGEPLIVHPEDDEQGYSTFDDQDPSYVMVPMLVYDEKLFRKRYIDSLNHDPEYLGYLCEWTLDMTVFAPPTN